MRHWVCTSESYRRVLLVLGGTWLPTHTHMLFREWRDTVRLIFTLSTVSDVNPGSACCHWISVHFYNPACSLFPVSTAHCAGLHRIFFSLHVHLLQVQTDSNMQSNIKRRTENTPTTLCSYCSRRPARVFVCLQVSMQRQHLKTHKTMDPSRHKE